MKPLESFKQSIISNIDNLKSSVSSFENKDIEGALNNGHLFHYKIEKIRNNGKEYTILTTITVSMNDKAKERPPLMARG